MGGGYKHSAPGGFATGANMGRAGAPGNVTGHDCTTSVQAHHWRWKTINELQASTGTRASTAKVTWCRDGLVEHYAYWWQGSRRCCALVFGILLRTLNGGGIPVVVVTMGGHYRQVQVDTMEEEEEREEEEELGVATVVVRVAECILMQRHCQDS